MHVIKRLGDKARENVGKKRKKKPLIERRQLLPSDLWDDAPDEAAIGVWPLRVRPGASTTPVCGCMCCLLASCMVVRARSYSSIWQL